MTQTREVSQDIRYRKLAGRAFKLSELISDEMERLDAMADERWAELHDVSKAVSAVFSTLARYRDRQQADSDLEAAIREANPGHPLTADTMLPASPPVDYWPF